MRASARLTNLGIEFSVVHGDPKPLVPAADANQENPRKNYVYVHVDGRGQIFYVGMGKGRRAWSTDRHPLWHRYVEKHLGRNYKVRILWDNLSADEAEELESEFIYRHAETLVNWDSARPYDTEALDRLHKLRNVNRSRIQVGRLCESSNLQEAVAMYIEAIDATSAYANIHYETGLVGQLLNEDAADLGINGELEALDRLTLCLVKIRKPAEAAQHADSYFALYRRDLNLKAAERITKRIKKALNEESRPVGSAASRGIPNARGRRSP